MTGDPHAVRPWMSGSEAEVNADLDAFIQFLTTSDPVPATNEAAIQAFVKQHSDRPVTPPLVVAIMRFLRSMQHQNVGRNTRLQVLEAKLCELEQKASAGCEWAGVHKTGQAYVCGQLVTKSGALWLCTRTTTATPGGDDSGFVLIVKRGSFDLREGAA